jgi:hypothetical protein
MWTALSKMSEELRLESERVQKEIFQLADRIQYRFSEAIG